MRLSSFLLPVTLLLFMGSTSAGPLSYANWSNPSVTTYDSDYCCIPTSIEIDCPLSYGCTAKYEYPSSMTSRCYTLFNNPTQGALKLEMLVYEGFLSSEVDPSHGTLRFSLSASNSTGSPQLKIKSAYGHASDGCTFTMNTRKPRASDISSEPTNPQNSSSNSTKSSSDLAIVIFCVAIAGICLKLWHKKQENIVKTQAIALTQLPAQPVPVQIPQQQSVQPQPQSTYTAPLNVQVGVSSNRYNAPGQVVPPNLQVNINSGGPGQYLIPQMNTNQAKKPGIVNRSGIV